MSLVRGTAPPEICGQSITIWHPLYAPLSADVGPQSIRYRVPILPCVLFPFDLSP